MKNSRSEILLIVALMVLGLVGRFLPHPANFTPILGLALFAGSTIKNRLLALALPLLGIFLTDYFFGFYDGMAFSYVAYAAIVGLGMIMKSRSSFVLAVNASFATVIFFLLSNLGVWWSAGLYEKSLTGLSQCFVMALPFLGNSWLSTLASTFVFFVSFKLFSAVFLTGATPAKINER